MAVGGGRYGVGGYIAPHCDGVKFDERTQRQSTTSFLLYLEDTADGGETVFLSQVPSYIALSLKLEEEKNITATWFDIIRFDRNTERYKQAITLAKLIILRYAPDLKGGRENILAIMFDMNLLYEHYIYRKLQKFNNENQTPITKIREQNKLPFWESKGIKADIVIESSNRSIVIDTKWKIMTDIAPSDADLKQMFVYNLHYDAHLSILLYPKTSHFTQDKKAFRHHKYSEIFCQLGFIELFDEKNKLNKNLGQLIYNELIKNNL